MTSHKKKTTTEFAAQNLGRDDAKLIKACLSGDERAWDELVERYQRLVFAIPRRSGLSESQAADILQEVFLTLFQKLDKIEQPDRIRSWLVTTAKFNTWALVRREKGFYSPDTEEELENELACLTDDSPLAEDNLIELEEQHKIRTALKKLEARCQTILSMIYLTEPSASYAEVAEAIGVGATSISPMRNRCLKKLEKILVN